jgi:hypothetical protein
MNTRGAPVFTPMPRSVLSVMLENRTGASALVATKAVAREQLAPPLA